jgi:hypothetical protein
VLPSISLYAGIATALLARGKRLRVAGLALAAGALAWPARERRAVARATLLDNVLPRWHFHERHAIAIDAAPERVFDAILRVTPREIALFRAFTAIRRGFAHCREGILNAAPDAPILDAAMKSGFRVAASDPPREIVLALTISKDVEAAMNFRLDGNILSTETRVHARTHVFALYWRLIHPGSDILRRTWLRAIRNRAESPDFK